MNRKERRSREAQTRAAPPGSENPELRQMMQRATGLHRDGQIDQALAAYEAVLAREPRHADALQYTAVAKMQSGQGDDAISLLKQAVIIDPNNSQAHYNLGLALRGAGKETRALVSLRRAIAVVDRYFRKLVLAEGTRLDQHGVPRNRIGVYEREAGAVSAHALDHRRHMPAQPRPTLRRIKVAHVSL